jgi:diguanylate cyclase (GGDEF)-like protein
MWAPVSLILNTWTATLAAVIVVVLAAAGVGKYRKQRRLLRQALRLVAVDALTGLPNRSTLDWHLDQARATRSPLVLAIIDLDAFAAFNHRHGHRVGDQLLVLLAARAHAEARRCGARVIRLARDEFAIMWPGQLPGDADTLVTAMMTTLAAPVELTIGDRSIEVATTVSAGVYTTPSLADLPTGVVLRRADIALQHARILGAGRAITWQAGMAHTLRRRDRDVFGLIEWDGSWTPTVITGQSVDAVQRQAVRILIAIHSPEGQFASDDQDFLTEHPFPDPNDPAVDVAEWLQAMREATTVPYFTVLDPDNDIRHAR